MNKMMLVLRNEISMTVKRRSFLLIVIGVPLAMALVALAAWFVNRPTEAGSAADRRTQVVRTEGFVDESGVIVTLPTDVPPAALTHYADEQSAKDALASGAIDAYYIVPADYVATGKLYYVDPQASLTTDTSSSWVMRWTLLVNMLGGDMEQAARMWSPMRLTTTTLAPEPKNDPGEELFMLPYLMVLGFYIVIVMSGSLLRNSLGDEKKNRMQEMLLTSTNPLHLLTGKIAALGIVGLLQMLLWASVGFVLLRLLGQSGIVPPTFNLPASLIFWTAVFFILGYAVYGSLLAGLGALTGPNTPGSSTADFVVIWPTITPIFLWQPIVTEPNGGIAQLLSLFPLTSPVAMVMRLIAGHVPLWELFQAIVLLALTAALIMRGVAAVFRAQVLLSGQPFTLKRYVGLILGRTEA